ncbi:hypothetical protein KDW_19830 [Dictyobacter vulcani]|uniref:Uncharacterized protein n=1 Tax=Dictyobacter vulcani TaxID=2607529 RepID=A0A5J4KND4_9CHLR|nr:hypothetical protein [Dictyobacter vulcani]GER87821.1 hypothetical protein KDW_19830 [Dictyobacter vulcani]
MSGHEIEPFYLYDDAPPLWYEMGLTPDVKESFLIGMHVIKAQKLSYMTLPKNITHIADDPLYQVGLLAGRLCYRDYLHSLDAHHNILRSPEPLPLQEVLDVVDVFIRIPDRYLAVLIPLTFRIGAVVGFLSGLKVSQSREAYAGLAVMAGLVTPLLVPFVDRQEHSAVPAGRLQVGRK